MAGDISRFSFQAAKANTGVRMQQGRVMLDADWNEQLDIQAYRERMLATDLLGSAVPSVVPGFAISTDGTALIVNHGRMYVEGILCENTTPCTVFPPAPPSTGSGSPTEPPNPGMSLVPLNPGLLGRTFSERVDLALKAKLTLAPVVSVSTSTAADDDDGTPAPSLFDTPVTSSAGLSVQPFLPSLPAVLQTGQYAVYLDVWERDITALEDPSIREVALGGPDTTTRTRVVWQVKLGLYDGPQGCPSNLYSEGILNPSASWLSARAAAADPTSNPCQISATAGYRSLENQLYRVEIHTPGQTGQASFKWSRDNASIVVGWEGGDGSLSVTSLGRDNTLGFAAGQWVELTDDSHEIAQKNGTLVQLSSAELVGQVPTLTIDTSTAAPGSDLTFAKFPSNPKVRRWDQSSASSTNLVSGAIPIVEETWIDLENGVQVYFGKGGSYQTGDFWLMPARTATTASQPTVIWPVDTNNAPVAQVPQGIRHHVASLAVVNFDGTNWSVLSDCRRVFAPISTVPAAVVSSVNTLDPQYKQVVSGSVLEPVDLFTGLHVAFRNIIDASRLNVSTFAVSLDLPASDELFAESVQFGQQVPAAIAVKALGNYSVVKQSGTTWSPFASTSRYFLTRLAQFGAVTLAQGRAQLQLRIRTAAILQGVQNDTGFGLNEEIVFTLSAWVKPYMDPTVFAGPVMSRYQVFGPDASGDYVAVGFMASSVFNQMMQLPAADVSGKIYEQPVLMATGKSVYAYVPTDLERKGNFSQFAVQLLDPATGGVIPGNVIPASEWPVAGQRDGIFAWRFRGNAPPPSPYAAYYGYGGGVVGGELI
ncbi:hypothetical protein FTO74_12585 [Granulicella sp. WH15]|uniref:DUF6519 domain-containing protein n=1 Tax=Granulicella sp. WH15 TaxID=2602070 RepID=UPI001366A5E0|nr:DUF6519 domain-containing protein [Granulicella sp. WH15]QHN04113.1 hypothetical protein FTO74_12585 [Granulicella sp. WH15]